MNLQEAIYRKSVLEKEFVDLLNSLGEYKKVPLKVNSKEQDYSEEEEILLDRLHNIVSILEEKLHLSDMIDKANYESGVAALLSEVKEKRRLHNVIKNIFQDRYYNNKVDIIEGVGVVQYGPLCHEELQALSEDLSEEINNISLKIDELNATTELDIDF